jgi:hypothetical protein
MAKEPTVRQVNEVIVETIDTGVFLIPKKSYFAIAR